MTDAMLDVVVVDDAPLLRGLLAASLRPTARVREAGDVPELFDLLRTRRADLVVLDVRMPPTYTVEGLEAVGRIRERHVGTGVLLLSQYVETHSLEVLLDNRTAGFGYLLKERVTGLDHFAEAVRRVAAGGFVVDPAVVETLMQQRRSKQSLSRLTGQERAVLELVAGGHTNASIASRLHLSGKTVEAYVHRVMARLDVPAETEHNRRVLVVLEYLRSLRTEVGSPPE